MIGSEFHVNTYTSNSQTMPSIASFSNSNFVVIWSSDVQDSSGWGIFGQLFAGNGSRIGNEFQVNTYTERSQESPAVTSFSNGNFVVTWTSDDIRDNSTYGIFGQLFTGNGSKLGSEFHVNTYTSNNQKIPSIANLNNGNFVVIWNSYSQDGSGDGIFGQLFAGNTTPIGNEFQVNAYTNYSQTNPSVTSLNNSNFVVVWESFLQDGSSDSIFGQYFNSNGMKIGNEFQVNTYVSYNQRAPSITSLSDGNFVVTWHSEYQDGSSTGVFGQLFDENATLIGNEFQINTYINNDQWFSTVTSLKNGNFIVTWSSLFQDSSGSGVFGQLFNDILLTSSITTSTTLTTSTTKTTSSMTSSISSSTTSVIGRTRTSMNLSNTTTVPSTTRPITTSDSRATLSVTPDPSNRFTWIWFLLGGVGFVSCLGLTGYFIFKSRDRKQDGDVHALELGEREQTNTPTAESDYQRTPDFVTERAGQEPHYQRTPDFVTERAGQEPHYQRTPDFVTAGDGGN